ncbi:MAG: proton-conducting transporter membrane subunit [Gammaproteobacteria bacterium]
MIAELMLSLVVTAPWLALSWLVLNRVTGRGADAGGTRHGPVPHTWTVALQPTVLAPLAVLMAAVLVPGGARLELDFLLLGSVWLLDDGRRALLLATALIWFAAAWQRARGADCAPRNSKPKGRNTGRDALFLLTFAGNLLVLVSLDAPGFFLGFALMGLAIIPLIARPVGSTGHGLGPHRLAHRAAAVTLALTILGEGLLLSALVMAAAGAPDLMLASLAANMNGPALTFALLALGIKLGAPLLHLWLPLAYTSAPAPIAAVLSGALMSAGAFALLNLLPLGREGFAAWGQVMIGVGLFSTFYAVAVGLCQRLPGALLGYSSMSQMGLLMALLGWTLTQGSVAGIATATALVVTVYAIHHGLLKGALFLLVGRRGAPSHALTVTLVALLGLALAGLPLTSGWWAKELLKTTLADAPWAWLLSISGIATTLLMARLVLLIRHRALAFRPGHRVRVGARSAVAALLGAPVLMYLASGENTPGWPGLIATWPVWLGVVLAPLLLGGGKALRLPRIRPGDIPLVIVDRLSARRGTPIKPTPGERKLPTQPDTPAPLTGAVTSSAKASNEGFEAALRQWPHAGLALLVNTVVLILILVIAPL